jgi:hypothetical protein
METLAALALATPIWGFALDVPRAAPDLALPAAQIEAAVEVQGPAAEAHTLTMMDWTRGFTLATMAAFAATAVLGFVQFADEYGFHERYEETACATGQSVMGYCGEATPWPHLLAAGTTAGLGLTTFVLSTQIDYDVAERHDSDWRIYETTRWIGLGMFAAQAALGFLLANAIRFGWADPQGDFETLQALSFAHMGLGVATFGLETFNSILIF